VSDVANKEMEIEPSMFAGSAADVSDSDQEGLRQKIAAPILGVDVSLWGDVIRSQKQYASQFENRRARGKSALLKLKRLILENEERFFQALEKDLGKSKMEAYASEIAVTLNEIDYLLRHLGRALRDRRVMTKPGSAARVSRRPYGSVLVMSPWNYPFQLALLPVAGALATGNGCFLKPSELAPVTSGLIAELAPKYFSKNEFAVVEGDGATAAALLDQNWDFIFFTGSERIGGIVAARAAKLRIPCILELGGKCPCIVDAESVNEVTARRIVWGKFFNAGQTCVAPDHVWVAASAAPKLLEELKKQIAMLYGEDPEKSRDYGRIVGAGHFHRLRSMLSDGQIYLGGRTDDATLFFEPTIITEPERSAPLMQEEIFGPILPILTWTDKDALLQELAAHPEPLAMYAFCDDRDLVRRLDNNFRSGAFCVNNVLEHVAKMSLPFGGVGNSGHGRYHGAASFETFTWSKVIYYKSGRFDFRLMYPPYNEKLINTLRRIRRWLP